MSRPSAPVVLGEKHNLSVFSSGEPALDTWLATRALKYNAAGASRTYVSEAGDRVVGYYSLAAGAIGLEAATGALKRNMPDPVPVMVLARLAIDQQYQGKGLGKALVKDALLRIEKAADIAGIRGVAVHAMSERARDFYLAIGFRPSPIDAFTLMVTLAELRREFDD